MKPMKTAPRTWKAGGTRMCSRGAGVPLARHLGSGKHAGGPPAPQLHIRLPPAFHVRGAVFMLFNVDLSPALQLPFCFPFVLFVPLQALCASAAPREFFPPALHPRGRDLEVAPPRRGARLQKTLAFSLVFPFPPPPRAGRPRPDGTAASLPLSMSAERFSWFSMLAFLSQLSARRAYRKTFSDRWKTWGRADEPADCAKSGGGVCAGFAKDDVAGRAGGFVGWGRKTGRFVRKRRNLSARGV